MDSDREGLRETYFAISTPGRGLSVCVSGTEKHAPESALTSCTVALAELAR